MLIKLVLTPFLFILFFIFTSLAIPDGQGYWLLIPIFMFMFSIAVLFIRWLDKHSKSS